MHILVACDKFKGTLTAAEANAAIVRGLLPTDRVQSQAIADGGEGTAALLGAALNAVAKPVNVVGPLGATQQAKLWIGQDPVQQQRLAFFDMSAASGLELLGSQPLDPWRATTFGTGQLLLAATKARAQQVLIGLGGSATNDGGAGLAQALGYGFYDAQGQALRDIPDQLLDAVELKAPDNLRLPKVTALCDVDNPLLGPKGATATFGPQKGIEPSAQAEQERRLAHLAALAKRCLNLDYAGVAGAGAAGGLGFGLLSFTQASLTPGFDRLAALLNLEQLVQAADLVITGEGSMDAQSLQGKGPVALARLATKYNKRCIALCGRTDSSPKLAEHFAQVLPLVTDNQPPLDDSAQALTELAKAHRATWSKAT